MNFNKDTNQFLFMLVQSYGTIMLIQRYSKPQSIIGRVSIARFLPVELAKLLTFFPPFFYFNKKVQNQKKNVFLFFFRSDLFISFFSRLRKKKKKPKKKKNMADNLFSSSFQVNLPLFFFLFSNKLFCLQKEIFIYILILYFFLLLFFSYNYFFKMFHFYLIESKFPFIPF